MANEACKNVGCVGYELRFCYCCHTVLEHVTAVRSLYLTWYLQKAGKLVTSVLHEFGALINSRPKF